MGENWNEYRVGVVMRLKIDFFADKLPVIYRHRFMALIKEALNESDSSYRERLYPEKNSVHSKVAKPFCFNVSMPIQREMKKDKIIIDNGVEITNTVFIFKQYCKFSLYISSSDFEFITNLYNGLLKIKEFKFNDEITLRFDKAFLLNEKKFEGAEVAFKTNAPILIEDKVGKPVLPVAPNPPPASSELQPTAYSHQHFNEHFNAIHDRILKDIRGCGLHKEMEFVPLNVKKQVVKHTLRGFREKTGKPYMTLTCFEGCFKLKGDPRDLQMLYQIGVGLRTGQGFGMVDIV